VLQPALDVNRLSERRPEDATLVPVDPERHALEMRIEHAKSRLVEDLNRASALVKNLASRAGRGVGTLAVVAGVTLVAVVLTLAIRRKRRQVTVRWR
jgi:hypothetical protein